MEGGSKMPYKKGEGKRHFTNTDKFRRYNKSTVTNYCWTPAELKFFVFESLTLCITLADLEALADWCAEDAQTFEALTSAVKSNEQIQLLEAKYGSLY